MLAEIWKKDRVWDFRGRVAVITGGARGIGAATARVLHHLGAGLAITYHRSQKEARELVRELAGSSPVRAYALDVTDRTAVFRVFEQIAQDFVHIDILVNNASYSDPAAWRKDLPDLPMSAFEAVLRTDLIGSWNCDQAVVPLMRRTGGGVILHLASSAALLGDADTALYSPAKLGLVGLTRSLARLLAPEIRVNAVAPGSVKTDWIDAWNLNPQDIQALADEVPLKRLLEPEEIAWTIAFLASPAARGITGQTWLVDAGMTLH